MTRLRIRKVRRVLLGSFVVLTALVVVLVSVRLAYGPAKGLFNRSFRSPHQLRDPSIQMLSPTTAATQRKRLVDMFLGRHGSYGLTATVGSVEGTPIGMTVLVKDGTLTLVRDYTRDSYGIREFAVQALSRVDLGPVLEEQLNPLNDRFPERNRVYLRCYVTTGEVVYF